VYPETEEDEPPPSAFVPIPEEPMDLRRLTCVLTLLAAAGCSSAPPDHAARLAELEVAVDLLRQRVEGLSTDRPRLEALETALAVSPREELFEARLALLEAGLLRLDERIGALAGRLDEMEQSRERPQRGRRFVTIEGDPSRGLPPPRSDEAVKVLTVGSGSLLLVRGSQGLERIVLLGVDPPRRVEEYTEEPALRVRHEEALARRLDSDEPWESSRRHLESLLGEESEVKLVYARQGPRRSASGAILAYVERQSGGEVQDVNAAMIRDGFALAAGEHDRRSAYLTLEREARAEGRGLFGEGENGE
jgi:endonuclease YncB( thermonuclease family)